MYGEIGNLGASGPRSVHPNSTGFGWNIYSAQKIPLDFFDPFDTHAFQWKFQWNCLRRKNPADLEKYSAGLCTDPLSAGIFTDRSKFEYFKS